jgi:hypothetical protein|nr:hypothetical protein [Rhodospirillales bacterium]
MSVRIIFITGAISNPLCFAVADGRHYVLAPDGSLMKCAYNGVFEDCDDDDVSMEILEQMASQYKAEEATEVEKIMQQYYEREEIRVNH